MKKYILLLLSLLIFLFFCTFNFKPSNNSQPVVGFSQSGTESTWRKRHTDSITTELEKGYQVLYRNGYMSQERQIRDLRSFIAYKVDLIVLAPLRETGWDEVLSEAKEANIPVIIVDRHIDTADDSLYLSHIGPSFKAEGQKSGIFTINYFKDIKDEEIQILEMAGLKDSSTTELRTEGFHETIARDRRMVITDTLYGDFVRMKSKEVFEDYFNKHPLEEIDAIYSHSDEMTHGILEYLKQTNQVPGVDIMIVTIDGQEDMIKELKRGHVNAVVECNPNAGWYVKNALDRYFSGKTLSKDIYMPETIFSSSNIDNIPTRNY